MLTRTFHSSFLAAVLLAASGVSTPAAQQVETDDIRAYIEMFRSEFNTSKIATINGVMKMTASEAEKFWPTYRKYENELAAVADRKLELVREFAALHLDGTLNDKKANDLATRWLKNTEERLALWRKYHKQISKKVSPVRAAQFLQIENQVALFVDLSIAGEMPAVGSKPSER